MSDVFRTRPEHAIVHPSGWHPVNDDFEIVKVPLIDATAKLSTDRAMFARVSHHDEEEVCRRLGAEFVTFDIAKAVWRAGVRLKPVQLVRTHADSERMRGRGFCEVHDARVWNQLEAIGWDGSEPVANIGKFWVKPSSKMARNCGWFDVNGVPVQPGGPGSERHDRDYTDYSQLCYVVRRRGAQTRDASSALGSAVGAVESAARSAAAWLSGVLSGEERPMRQTIKLGSRGADVKAWQGILRMPADGVFGVGTENATRAWQEARGLVADGVVGRKSWELAGERYAAPKTPSVDPRAPACVAALRDANAAWPTRKKASDGIMGDAAHQARPSDHNLGNAVDVTHDPASGCDAGVIVDLATRDPRVTYVIWDRRIWSRARADEGWRPYAGSNPHTKHVHISVRTDARDDASPWPWAPVSAGP